MLGAPEFVPMCQRKLFFHSGHQSQRCRLPTWSQDAALTGPILTRRATVLDIGRWWQRCLLFVFMALLRVSSCVFPHAFTRGIIKIRLHT